MIGKRDLEDGRLLTLGRARALGSPFFLGPTYHCASPTLSATASDHQYQRQPSPRMDHQPQQPYYRPYDHYLHNHMAIDDDDINNHDLLNDEPYLDHSLQKQVSVMSMNLSSKLDELQRGDRQLETTVALCEIRTQLQELTKSVESCQTEVSEVKRDMVAIKVRTLIV